MMAILQQAPAIWLCQPNILTLLLSTNCCRTGFTFVGLGLHQQQIVKLTRKKEKSLFI